MLQAGIQPRPLRPADSSSPSNRRHTARQRPIARSRANIGTACLACRQRKRKCLGGRPCPGCQDLGTACSYDEEGDRRRKMYNNKARADCELQQRVLDSLLALIRSEQCDRVIRLVQENESVNLLADQLRSLEEGLNPETKGVDVDADGEVEFNAHGLSFSDDDEFSGLSSQSSSQSRTMPVSVAPPPPPLLPMLLLPSLNGESTMPMGVGGGLPMRYPQIRALHHQQRQEPLPSLISLPSFDEFEALASRPIMDR